MEERVTFISEGKKLVGLVFFPDAYREGKKYPALVFDGPMTGLKDQVTAVYARRLAAHGYLCLTFDHRFYGESEGEPRQLEAPDKKVEDIQNAVSYLLMRTDVDHTKVGAVGICAGGGYMAKALTQLKSVKAFVGIAGCYHDPKAMLTWLGEEDYNKIIARSRTAEGKFQKSGEVEYIQAVTKDPADTNAAMPTEEPFLYYGTARGYSPNYVNRFAVMGYERLLRFNAVDSAKEMQAPTLIIHGTHDNFCVPDNARNFYEGLAIAKEFFWIDTTNHIDLYDQDVYVDQAAGEAARWFNKYLLNRAMQFPRRVTAAV